MPRGSTGAVWGPVVLVFGCAEPGSPVAPGSTTPHPPTEAAIVVDLDPEACADDRYPAMAGDWAVGCSSTGRVDLAVDVHTGLRVVLEDPPTSPGLADGALYAPGLEGGTWRLPEGRRTRETPVVPGEPIAPPAFDGAHVVVLFADAVEVFTLGEAVRKRVEARPRPWTAPALTWPTAAWLDEGGVALLAHPDAHPTHVDVDARQIAATADGFVVGGADGLRTLGRDGRVGDPVGPASAARAPVAAADGGLCAETEGPPEADLGVPWTWCTDRAPIPGAFPSRGGGGVLVRADGATWWVPTGSGASP